MKRILTTLVLLTLFGLAGVHASGSESSDAHSDARADGEVVARFFTELPGAAGELLAEAELGAHVDADLSHARYVVLDTVHGSYTFAIEKTASTAHEIRVALKDAGHRAHDTAAATLLVAKERLELVSEGKGEIEFAEGGEGSAVQLVVAIHLDSAAAGSGGGASAGADGAEVDVDVDVDGSVSGEADGSVDAEVADAPKEGADSSAEASASAAVDAQAEADGEAHEGKAEAGANAEVEVGASIGVGSR